MKITIKKLEDELKCGYYTENRDTTITQLRILKDVIQLIENQNKLVSSQFDKPKEGTPIVTWNYSLKFISNNLNYLLKELRGEKK